MKVRSDFVTNSSSSSFICEVCGDMESGWDASLSDVGMVRCSFGHEFCEEHKLDMEESFETIKQNALQIVKEKLKNYKGYAEDKNNSWAKGRYEKAKIHLEKLESISEDDFDKLYEELKEELKEEYEEEFEAVPSNQCPICQMKEFKDDELVEYFVKSSGHNLEYIKGLIKNKFESYYDFKKFIAD